MKGHVEIRVRYIEIDQMGVVNNVNYFRWLEEGRVELLRDLGMPLIDIERSGTILMIAETLCNYLSPARYDELLILETWISHVGNKSIRFDYRVSRKEDEKVIARAHTVHVTTDKTGKSKLIPPDLKKVLTEAME
ncbi:MAG: acyl-CoA thioesterase [Candidatus Thermoplasmatota archaeon]|nr:acyl-CoA thioesterase [Euryarchaeota archaeon]MBU4032052.1 acyl-CoA thioesterase [Candidatus Thermoplasmatota archaeon]MBU4070680.1 acyl-CoA thioesterase [Candidatus Thermoplasmatota archaeon]MBU4143718.1 acyl-CoA thioesterase [Candidatus Thermoplasmatota archaeon]MBU4592401.1 acyl-CoA thioesterase [Candidatus Thermoplasmatota archaeon]